MNQFARSNDQLGKRTKQFAFSVMRLVDGLPNGRTADVLAKQLLRAATSVGANYRAACRGRSRLEFCAKLGIVEEEADECVYWLELLNASGLLKASDSIDALHAEANEIVAMVVASIRTARRNQADKRNGRTQ